MHIIFLVGIFAERNKAVYGFENVVLNDSRYL